MEELEKKAISGELTKSSLVWTKGMSSWMKAEEIEELNKLFDIMPPIPNSEMPPIPSEME